MELSEGVGRIPGVGPKKAAALARLGVATVFDLLTYYPRAYIDQSVVTPLSALSAGTAATVTGVILSAEERRAARGMSVLTARVGDGTGFLSLVWFNQPFLVKQLEAGRRVFVTGKAERSYGGLSMTQMTAFAFLDGAEEAHGAVLPVYAASGALTQAFFRRIVRRALDQAPALPEVIPAGVRARYELMARGAAMEAVHFPPSMEAMEAARARLAFEELYLIQCGLMLVRKRTREREKGVRHLLNGALVRKAEAALPFRLTEGQARAWREIASDMESPLPMRRLLEGDVGSGKTAVALLALVKTVENGYQGTLMAPTEILARQHYETFTRLLAGTGARVALLSGKQSAKERAAARAAVAAHEADIVVGTHALIQEGVRYDALGLVVTDEQHRFGISQRAELRRKGARTPDVLVMTATPIPRTMTLTVYGDLDVSRLEELPPGRRPVRTFVRTAERRALVYAFVRKELEAGRQAYVVCPVIEEREAAALPSAEEVYRTLSEGAFRDVPCGLVHGRLRPKEKEAAMRAFYEGRTKLLVATTVVEVGVDVPNATVMVVEHAERFGLAQLHQLRGRIGRGAFQSYCILLSEGRTEAARARLGAMERTTSGFLLAEEDLRLRGPGQFFGAMQHGLGDLKIANVLRDTEILLRARRAAMETMEAEGDTRYVLDVLRMAYRDRFDRILDG